MFGGFSSLVYFHCILFVLFLAVIAANVVAQFVFLARMQKRDSPRPASTWHFARFWFLVWTGGRFARKFVSLVGITGAKVGARVAAVTGIPQECQRLVTGTGQIRFEMYLVGLEVGDDGMLPSCSVVLRLRGGKGDFGSLLRGAATKAGRLFLLKTKL
jgi:hypothetical protein